MVGRSVGVLGGLCGRAEIYRYSPTRSIGRKIDTERESAADEAVRAAAEEWGGSADSMRSALRVGFGSTRLDSRR